MIELHPGCCGYDRHNISEVVKKWKHPSWLVVFICRITHTVCYIKVFVSCWSSSISWPWE